MDGRTNPVALIQLSSHQGTCALVRVCQISTLPPSLIVKPFFSKIFAISHHLFVSTFQSLLSSPEILKVGVATWEDASKLRKDMNVEMRGSFDIRHLINHHPQRHILWKKSGLSGLAEKLLDVQLNKHFTVRCSDWENEQLSNKQITYAAQDALASIALCLKLVTEYQITNKEWTLFQDAHIVFRNWSTSFGKDRSDTRIRMPNISNEIPTKKSKSPIKQPPPPKPM